MENAIVDPAFALANVSASRSVQVPVPLAAQAFVESPALLTVTVAAVAAPANNRSPTTPDMSLVVKNRCDRGTESGPGQGRRMCPAFLFLGAGMGETKGAYPTASGRP